MESRYRYQGAGGQLARNNKAKLGNKRLDVAAKKRLDTRDSGELAPAKVVVPLEDFVRLRRPYETKAVCSWHRDARAGKIPGAFQFGGRGRWYVSLDVYDEEVQKLSSPKHRSSPAEDTISQVARLLNIDETHLAALKGVIECK